MPRWLESLFEFLFKYGPAVFAKGDFAFGTPRWAWLPLLAGAIIGAVAVATYAMAGGRSTRRDRWTLAALRVAILLLVLFCLSRPMLLLSTAVPQRNWVGVLVDDSRSMQIADHGAPRSDVVRHALGGPDSVLLRGLRERFQVRLFRFGAGTQRIAAADDLTFAAVETRLVDAIDQASRELEGVPLSGLVVLTDGADNSHAPVADALRSLRARSVPVFAVGLGAERFEKDIEITRVEAPRAVLKGSTIVADVLVRQRGFRGARVPLVVEDNGRIVARQEVTLRAGDAAPVRVHVPATERGARTLTFRIAEQPGEQVTQNNARQALVQVRDRREKILYVEGEPRHEMRFVRRAVEADSNLQLVVLQRTAENKFLRLDVDDGEELAAGFPRSRAELFRYSAIVLGSIEASFFTHDQLQMLADFAGVRGGGLLFLGGRRAFAEGGYAGTPVADAMPVLIAGEAVADSLTFLADLTVHLTPLGASHAVAQVAATDAQSAQRWRTIPQITSVNRIRGVKPGAVTLLAGTVGPNGRSGAPGERVRGYEQPVLAWQHFGRGLTVALPVQDTWLWQMHADIPVGDPTFTTFWRQLLRWITDDVPSRVHVALESDQASPGAPVTVRAEVADSGYVRRNDARVVAHVTAPSGAARELPLEWMVDRDGEYRATFTPSEEGVHAIRVDAELRGAARASDSTYVRVTDGDAEYFDAEMRASLLQRIASETGGRFYTPAMMGSLPTDVAMSRRGVTVVNQLDLWDMPAAFLLLVLLAGAEWAYRKTRGLA